MRIRENKEEIARHTAALSIFEAFDDDNSGSIDKHELVELSSSMGLAIDVPTAESLISTLDVDGSGTLSFPEFWKWFRSMDQPSRRRSSSSDARFVVGVDELGVEGADPSSPRSQGEERSDDAARSQSSSDSAQLLLIRQKMRRLSGAIHTAVLGKRDTDARNSLHRQSSAVGNSIIAAAPANRAGVRGGAGEGAGAAEGAAESAAESAAVGAAVGAAAGAAASLPRSSRAPGEARAERIALRRLSAGGPVRDAPTLGVHSDADGSAEVDMLEEALGHLHQILSPHARSEAPWSEPDAWQPPDREAAAPAVELHGSAAESPPLWEEVHSSAVPSGRSEPPWIKYRDSLSKRRFWRNAETGETAWAEE